jgi:hypothetical protein
MSRTELNVSALFRYLDDIANGVDPNDYPDSYIHPIYHAYVDGSYGPNGGSWGAVITNHDTVIDDQHGIVPEANIAGTRNVGCECYAVQRVLDYCHVHGIEVLIVHYDYTGIEAWPTGKWRANNPITSNYATIVKSCGIQITWVHDNSSGAHVKAHNLANAVYA